MKRFGAAMSLFCALLVGIVATPVLAAIGDIVTVAGGAIRDGGPSEQANVLYGAGVAVDSSGNVYVADTGNNRIRVINGDGTIITIVGSGNGGFFGDGGPAGSAGLRMPTGVAIDSTGNIYIADQGNNRIRKVTAGTPRIITTIAGTGAAGYSGDGGPASAAQIDSPYGIAVDSNGNVFFSDWANHRVRMISAADRTISTVAGTGDKGNSGDEGPATQALLYFPEGLAVDASGNLYIADTWNNRIRKVSAPGPNGKITAFAGNGSAGSTGDNGPATAAMLNSPSGVAVHGSEVYIADRISQKVRKVSGGIITTVAGTGIGGSLGDGGLATAARLRHPTGIAVDSAGNFYFPEQGNDTVRKVTAATKIITTIAGNPFYDYGGDGGPASAASLNFPWSIAIDSGDLYIADQLNNRIRKISASTGFITTIAGNGLSNYSEGGLATTSPLGNPRGVALHPTTREVYFTDTSNHRIRRISAADGTLITVAGSSLTPGYSGDGEAATAAMLNLPSSLVFDAAGNLYFTDENNHRVRKVGLDGKITTVAGNGTGTFAGDGGAATAASLWRPSGLAIDGAGNLYIADMENNRIRKVASGVINTVAGNGNSGFSGDGPAIEVSLYLPAGLAVDKTGAILIADQYNHLIRKLSGDKITTVAGNRMWDYAGDNGPAIKASIAHPTGLAVDANGNIFIADRTNKAIREVVATVAPVLPGPPTNVVATAGNAEATVTFSAPATNGGNPIAGYSVTSIPAGGVDTNAGATTLSHRITGLTNGTPYTFTVTATTDAGTGPPSNASNSVTPATIPGAPISVTAAPGNGQATVKFSAPLSDGGADITGYTVTSHPGGGVDSTAGTTALTHVVTGLTNGSPYTFTVTATNRVGSGPASAPSNNATPAFPPGAPQTVAATAGNARATVSFAPPASDGGNAITGYTVLSNPAGGVDSNAGSLALSHVVTGLKNGTAYTFTVAAKNAIASGVPSAPSNKVMPLGPPGAPVILSAKGGNAQAAVTFAAPASNGGSTITGYTVFSSPLGGVDTYAGTTRDPHIVTGLKNGTAYVFTVVAKNALGTSPPSAKSSVVIPATVPDPPTAVTAKAGNARATVTFAAPLVNGGSRIIGYTVLSSPSGGVDTNAGTTALPHTVTGLKNGTTYAFTVIAKNAVGASKPSLPSNLVKPATVPNAPTTVTAKAGNAQASVTFAAPLFNGGSPITGYTVFSNPAGGIDSNAGKTGVPHIVTGLKNGVAYTFTVVAKNAVGTGAASLPSNRIVPTATLAASGVTPGFAGGEPGQAPLAVRPGIKRVRRTTPTG